MLDCKFCIADTKFADAVDGVVRRAERGRWKSEARKAVDADGHRRGAGRRLRRVRARDAQGRCVGGNPCLPFGAGLTADEGGCRCRMAARNVRRYLCRALGRIRSAALGSAAHAAATTQIGK